jgi:hypothetical protein
MSVYMCAATEEGLEDVWGDEIEMDGGSGASVATGAQVQQQPHGLDPSPAFLQQPQPQALQQQQQQQEGRSDTAAAVRIVPRFDKRKRVTFCTGPSPGAREYDGGRVSRWDDRVEDAWAVLEDEPTHTDGAVSLNSEAMQNGLLGLPPGQQARRTPQTAAPAQRQAPSVAVRGSSSGAQWGDGHVSAGTHSARTIDVIEMDSDEEEAEDKGGSAARLQTERTQQQGIKRKAPFFGPSRPAALQLTADKAWGSGDAWQATGGGNANDTTVASRDKDTGCKELSKPNGGTPGSSGTRRPVARQGARPAPPAPASEMLILRVTFPHMELMALRPSVLFRCVCVACKNHKPSIITCVDNEPIWIDLRVKLVLRALSVLTTL